MSDPAITRTSAPISYLVSLDAANTRPQGSMTVSGRVLDVREVAGDFDGCCREVEYFFRDCIESYVECANDIESCCRTIVYVIDVLPQLIKEIHRLFADAVVKFFNQRNADFQLFKRAFVSMGNGATPEDIQQNRDALIRLRDCLLQFTWSHINDASVASEPRTDVLLNYHFRVEILLPDNRGVRQETDFDFSQEIIRECNVALFFQDTLSVVNIFYNMFGINSHWLNQLFENNGLTPNGTVRYDLGRIPLSVNEKSKKIEILTKQFDQLQEHVDNLRKCKESESAEAKDLKAVLREFVVQMGCNEAEVLDAKFFDVSELHKDFMLQIMTIPVFDVAHPEIQDQFTLLSEAFSIASDDRMKRHVMDWQTFETQFRGEMASALGVRCSNCRHSMKRENMLIDTDLQDDILNFLMRKLPNASTTAVQP